MSNLNLPNLKHLEGKPLPGRKAYEVKGSEFVEVSQGGLEDAFNMLKSPEAEVNPRYRAIVGGYVHLKNALIHARAAIRLAKNEAELNSAEVSLVSISSALDAWPIKLPPKLTASKPSQGNTAGENS